MREAPSPTNNVAGTGSESHRSSALSHSGLIVGAIALLATVAPYVLHDWRKPEKRSLTEVVTSTVREIRDSSPKSPSVQGPWDWTRVAQSVSLGGGALAILLGVFGWVRRENVRAAVAAIALGALPLAWTVALIAFVVVLVLAALGVLISFLSG
jgi:hypothetical protein